MLKGVYNAVSLATVYVQIFELCKFCYKFSIFMTLFLRITRSSNICGLPKHSLPSVLHVWHYHIAIICSDVHLRNLCLTICLLWFDVSRQVVMSCEAKKKHHAPASLGLHNHYSELFTQMAALIFLNTVTQPLLQQLLSLLNT